MILRVLQLPCRTKADLQGETIMVVEKRDIATVGKAMYEELCADMEANHWGRMVVIDVNTGEYEVDDDDLTATLRLMERVPSAMT